MTRTALRADMAAPAFSLADQNGRKVALDDLAGQWAVIYFYPKDDTPGCTREACEFTTHLKDFEKLSARVIGVSPDSPESHRAFIEKYDLKLDLLSDPDHSMLADYGAWGRKTSFGRTTEGVIRSTVVLDPDGRIAVHWPHVKAPGHAEAVGKCLAKLAGA